MPVLSDAPRVREGVEAEVGSFVCLQATPPRDDREILQAIKAGDARALGHLYSRYGPSVVALCRRILGDPTEAEDAALDSFVQVWEQSDRYDPSRASPLTYLMTIARSRAIDRLRARRRRPVPVDWNDEAWPERESSQPVPYDAAVEAERRDRVQAALRALSERERRPIELSFYAGLSHREIAERLVLPLGTVKTRIRQGLIRLRGLVQNDGSPL
jgi:RNA polymerase sigma-70 factor (ECF subfamily)